MRIRRRKPGAGQRGSTGRRFGTTLLVSGAFHAALVAAFSFGGPWAVRAGREGVRSAVLEVEDSPDADFAREDETPAEPLPFAGPAEPFSGEVGDLDVEPPEAEPVPSFVPPSPAREVESSSVPARTLDGIPPASWRVQIDREDGAATAGERAVEPETPTAEASPARTPEAASVPAPSAGPRLLDAPPPRYPSASIRAGEQGTVLCRLHVTAEGTVSEVEIVESSGHPRLDEAAREGLLRWRFAPGVEGGRAVPSTLLHPVEFVLTGPG
jgi:protein TonB